MNINEIKKQACEILNIDWNKLSGMDNELLLRSISVALNEINVWYFPRIVEFKAKSVKGKISCDQFPPQYIETLAVSIPDEKRLPKWKSVIDGIKIKRHRKYTGPATIICNLSYDYGTSGNNCPIICNPDLTTRIVALGACTEFETVKHHYETAVRLNGLYEKEIVDITVKISTRNKKK